jgi:hypothetical protein
MSARWKHALLAASLAGCGGGVPESPWLAPDALDAETWGQVCGSQRIPSFEDPRFSSRMTEVIWASPSETPGSGVAANCVVWRDKQTGRLAGLEVSVRWWRYQGLPHGVAQETVERLRQAVLAELSPRHRPWALLASLGWEQTQTIGRHTLWAGYDLDGGRWSLTVYRFDEGRPRPGTAR